jgi:hypothetical protein
VKLFAVLLLQATLAVAQQPTHACALDSLGFLIGKWIGEGSGEPGQGTGAFTFGLDLQGKILIRRNHADYPATKDKPAYSHDDLMVMYEEPGDSLRAVYFDNEGHVINYGVYLLRKPKSVTFVSEIKPSAPRFRLTYVHSNDDRLKISFEIAPPGKPDAFAPYIEASAHRERR